MRPGNISDVDELAGTLAGEEVYVLGNGPSLLEARLDGVPRALVVGVNRVRRTVPLDRVGAVVFSDLDVWRQERAHLLAADHLALVVGPELLPQIVDELPARRTFAFLRERGAPHGAERGPFPYEAYLTGCYAAELAARMVRPGGRIVLCGFDLEYRRGEPTHAHCRDGSADGCTPRRFPEGVAALLKLRRALAGVVELRVVGRSRLLRMGFAPLSHRTKKPRFSA